MSETQERNSRKVLQGVCSGAKGNKTITVTVERRFQHPKYRKFIRRHVKVYAHDETNQASEGDIVEVVVAALEDNILLFLHPRGECEDCDEARASIAS